MEKYLSVPIANTVNSGTTTSTTANKLVQTGQNFTTTITVGDVVRNTTDSTWATVTAIDSATTLSLSADIMASGETYVIYSPTNATNQIMNANNVVLCTQATTSTVTVLYSTASSASDVLTITHQATAAGVITVRQAFENALILAATPKSGPTPTVQVVLPTGVIVVGMALA